MSLCDDIAVLPGDSSEIVPSPQGEAFPTFRCVREVTADDVESLNDDDGAKFD